MSTITFPDEYQLERTGSNYFETEDDPEAVAYCVARNALYDQMVNGTLYVKFIDGDRRGSIARIHLDPDYRPTTAEVTRRYYSRWDEKHQYEIENQWFCAVAKWDKRKNSCKLMLPHKDVIFLPNYQGPTAYQMFDKKAAREELLKSPDQRDIDGRLLSIGDKVLYINARYGTGFELCHGTIKEFKVSVDSKGHAFVTIVQNDGSEEESAISYPTQMIWKK